MAAGYLQSRFDARVSPGVRYALYFLWLGAQYKILTVCSGHSQPRTHRGHDAKFPGMAITYALMQRLEDIAEATPDRVQIIKKARVTAINKDAADPNLITGVTYEADGSSSVVDGVVILATGGYAADFTDTSLLKKHRPEVYGLSSTNGVHATGDGQKMCLAIGANGVDMDKVQVHPTGLVDPKDPGSKWKFLAAEGMPITTIVFDTDIPHANQTIPQRYEAKGVYF